MRCAVQYARCTFVIISPEESAMQDYEKLGVFYLGREYDLSAKQLRDDLILYDSKDLVTHAVVVGMTGSGKTGLCIDLIEEAAIDGVPVHPDRSQGRPLPTCC